LLSENVPYLFVYGTLRPGSGYPMAQFLAGRARWLGSACARGRLYDLGWYPGMVGATADDDWVQGDLYELADPLAALSELDRYEIDASAQFERRQATIVCAAGQQHVAWIYFYNGKVQEGQRIASGNYLQRSG
jgi:gamma-glutamylcyclotransferase (GGCT)/AIG2-like uncharacterized protein YtfP